MGGVGSNSAHNVVHDVISDISPDYILMTGVAFGLKQKNKTLGDVLVSERIQQYEVNRISADSTDWKRGESIGSGSNLYSRFSNTLDWTLTSPKRKTPFKVHHGLMLSGEKLIDNAQYVTILEKEFPKAVGGDMEGASLSSVCERKKLEWIIIKGICDWGKGKAKNHQAKAAYSSNHFTHHVFSKSDSFTDISKSPTYEKFIEPIDFDAEKGTPLWALNRLRSNVLTAMISDLKLHEAKGLEQNVISVLQNDIDNKSMYFETFHRIY